MTSTTPSQPNASARPASLEQAVRQMLAVTAAQWEIVRPVLRLRRKPAKRFDVPAAVRIWVRGASARMEHAAAPSAEAPVPCCC